MAISVEHLSRTYTAAGDLRGLGVFKAVDDLSLEVGPGEIVGLIGPNGAGKTTTLRALAGISVDGRDIMKDAIEAKRRLAFMPDEPHLFEYLTVDEHLRLIGRLYGVSDIDRRASALIDELELKGKEGSLPGELSRGMRQKVVIACGLVREATTLLFDEPLTGLDPIGIRRMRETIVARGRSGSAILLSSHLLHLVEEICSRVIIMDRGKKIADGTFEQLASRADLADAGSNLEQIFMRVTGRDASATSGSSGKSAGEP
jgi:ABC-2 type transport system ATP-binding protein